MAYQKIKLSEIVVNQDNDRHGSKGSELAAIEWLIKKKNAHMRSLIKDIASSGQIYEPPLLMKLDGASKYTVFDGNRRTAALKILTNPSLVKDHSFKSFVEGVLKDHGAPSEELTVQIEDDIDYVEEVIFRRHSGSQSGVGQSPWDPAAKQNFQVRTGKHTKLNIASVVEECLKELGEFEPSEYLKRSVFNRLFSAEVYRARVGLMTKSNVLYFTHDADTVIKALKKILADMGSGSLTLATVWSQDEKTAYLNKLDKSGFLPGVEELKSSPMEFTSENLKTKADSTPEEEEDSQSQTTSEEETGGGGESKKDKENKDTEFERNSLIPHDALHQIDWPDDTKRIRQIWRELQLKLDLQDHICAISVLERVLIELVVDRYIGLNSGVDTKAKDNAAQKIKKVANYLEAKGEISSDYRQALSKLSNGEEIVSMNTLNKYVHSAKLNPSPVHLCAIWDTLSEFVIACLKT